MPPIAQTVPGACAISYEVAAACAPTYNSEVNCSDILLPSMLDQLRQRSQAALDPVVASSSEGYALQGASTAVESIPRAGRVPTGGTTLDPTEEPQVTPDCMEVVIDILYAEECGMLSSYINYWC